MTDKSTLSKTFNTQFFSFLDDILTILPKNKDILTARRSFETIKRANPTIIIKVWYQHVNLPYQDVIFEGDISFFYEKDYSSDLSTLANNGEVLKVIDKIRQPIKEMSENNKNQTTKYLQVLTKLADLYEQN